MLVARADLHQIRSLQVPQASPQQVEQAFPNSTISQNHVNILQDYDSDGLLSSDSEYETASDDDETVLSPDDIRYLRRELARTRSRPRKSYRPSPRDNPSYIENLELKISVHDARELQAKLLIELDRTRQDSQKQRESRRRAKESSRLQKQRHEQFKQRMLDEVACSICHETMQEAVVLKTCGHSFCAGCLQSWLDSQVVGRQNQRERATSTCPTCRVVIQDLQKCTAVLWSVRKVITELALEQ